MTEVTEENTSLKTGLFFDSRCQLHQANYRHPEGPARQLKSYARLINTGLWSRGVHVQLAGSCLQDSFDGSGAKCVYGSDTPGLMEGSADPDAALLVAELHKEAPQFASALQPQLTVKPVFCPQFDTPQELLGVASILRVHEAKHIEDQIEKANADHGVDEVDSENEDDDTVYPGCTFASADQFLNRFTAAAASAAVSGTSHLAAAVASGKCRNGFSLVRPPGHHAAQRSADGFCLYNNVAIAVEHVRSTNPEAQKVLIVDFDVHHGNGTQACFYTDPNTLFVSIHQFGKGFFPETGDVNELGEAEGKGFTINLPVTVSVNDYEYLYAWNKVVLPITAQFQPDMVFISAGFDCQKGDSLGNMQLSPEGLFYLTRTLMDPVVCPSQRVVAALEGGYNPEVVADGVCAVVRALMGDPLPPLRTHVEGMCTRDIQRFFARVRPFYQMIETSRKSLASFWPVVAPAKLAKGQPSLPSYTEVCESTLQELTKYQTHSSNKVCHSVANARDSNSNVIHMNEDNTSIAVGAKKHEEDEQTSMLSNLTL